MFGKRGNQNVLVEQDGNATSVFVDNELKFKLTKQEMSDFSADVKKWYKFLNVTIGAASLAFAQAAQGTPHPPLNAAISLLWLTILYFALKDRYFPHQLTMLRRNNDPTVKKIRKIFERKFLGTLIILRKMPFFVIGYLYLILIISMYMPGVQNFEVFGTQIGKIFIPSSCVCYAVK